MNSPNIASKMAALTALAMSLGESVPDRRSYQPTPSGKLPDKPLPKGTNLYEFPNGFKCIAISQKSANKKHDKYLKQHKNSIS